MTTKYQERVRTIEEYLKKGLKSFEIANLMKISHSTIYNIIWKTWGTKDMVALRFPVPIVPEEKLVVYMFTNAEREVIKKGLDNGFNVPQLAKILKRTKNQLQVEVRKGGGIKNYDINKAKEVDELKMKKRTNDDKTNNRLLDI
jgi:IS30 family transposase